MSPRASDGGNIVSTTSIASICVLAKQEPLKREAFVGRGQKSSDNKEKMRLDRRHRHLRVVVLEANSSCSILSQDHSVPWFSLVALAAQISVTASFAWK